MAKRRSGSASDRDGPPKRRRPPPVDVDAQALAMREVGNSFSAIARRLELERASDAHRSFLRAAESYDGAARQRIVDSEEARLNLLEARIRQRDAAQPDKLERRLAGVAKYRAAIGR